jgi:hypothetical protein
MKTKRARAYAFKIDGPYRKLVETTAKEAALAGDLKLTHWTRAHEWVKAGGLHETGLYVDGGRVRYAEAME